MTICYGISSKTVDNLHIVFVDVDTPHTDFAYTELCNMLVKIQKYFRLSDFYILHTLNGYNAFTLDKVELEFLHNILFHDERIDIEFNIFNFKRGYYTLRLGADKTYTVNEIAYKVCELLNVKPNIKYFPERKEAKYAYSTHSKIRKYFKIDKEISLYAGLKIMADWVKKWGVRKSKEFKNIEIRKNLPSLWK